MMIHEMTDLVKGKEFKLFDKAEYIGGICATGCGEYTRNNWMRLPNILRNPRLAAAD